MSEKFKTFGKYTLLEKLASGGMAEIFLVRSTGAEGLVKFLALKRILPHFSDNIDFIDMFTREAKIVINLSHRSIVSIHEFGKENNRLFLTMDYVEGINLRQVIKKLSASKIKLPLEHVIYIVKEIASGLDYAHRCLDGSTGRPLNIIHRDVSPQNVMINFEGEIKIIDFGIAKAANQIEQTMSSALKGKFRYMSPEQASGKVLDHRTDIFSLGIILWELLANRKLFTGENEIILLRKVQKCNIPHINQFNPFITSRLEKILSKSLAADPKMRYQKAETFFKDLNKYLNHYYPDFSPHDFSGFIKDLYNKEIQGLKKKLITYVNVSNQNQNVEDVKDKKSSEPQSKTSFEDQTASSVSSDTEVTEKTSKSLSGISFQASRSFNKKRNSKGEDLKKVSKGKKGAKFQKAKSLPLLNNDEKTKAYPAGLLKKENSLSNDLSLVKKNNFSKLKEEEATKVIPTQTRKKANSFKTKEPFRKEGLESSKPIYEKKDLVKGKDTQFKRGAAHLGDQKGTIKKGENLEKLKEKNHFYKSNKSHLKQKDFRTKGSNQYKGEDPLILKSRNSLKSIFPIFILLMVVLSGYLFFHPNKGMREKFRNQVGKVSKMIPLKKEHQLLLNYKSSSSKQDENKKISGRYPSSKENPYSLQAKLLVSSTPSGAKIFINGQDTKKTTPSRVDMVNSKPFFLELKKRFYKDYVGKNMVLKRGESIPIHVNLIRIPVAYLTIDGLPKRNIKVYIDNVLLKEVNFPIKNKKVPALRNLKVRVLNLKTKRWIEKKIYLQNGVREIIFFDFKSLN